VALHEKTKPSVVFVQSNEGSCTGFVINSNWRGNKDLVATDEHCNGGELFADNYAARVIWKDSKADLMVLEIDDTGRPALKLAVANPKTGQEIGSWGFGYALEEAMFRHAYVSNATMPMPGIEGGPFVMIDAAYVGGQSGGPCINIQGEVVSIVQRASNLVGIGVGAEKLRDRIGKFFEVKP
jgi:S1-C subfamily serine protease